VHTHLIISPPLSHRAQTKSTFAYLSSWVCPAISCLVIPLVWNLLRHQNSLHSAPLLTRIKVVVFITQILAPGKHFDINLWNLSYKCWVKSLQSQNWNINSTKQHPQPKIRGAYRAWSSGNHNEYVQHKSHNSLRLICTTFYTKIQTRHSRYPTSKSFRHAQTLQSY
jgi:hypothetical protein